MKSKVFIDTDILLDLLAQREPFYPYAAQLFTLVEEDKLEAFTSPVVFSNLFYILSKHTNRTFAHYSLRKLRLLIKVTPVNEKVVDLALNSEFKDFEDAIQFYAAKLQGLDFIITRNTRDFVSRELVVLTAEEFMEQFAEVDNDGK